MIEFHCDIGHPTHNCADASPLTIRKNSFIRLHSIFYDGSNNSAYPWCRHFHCGYLTETVAQWIEEFKKK